MHTHIPAQHYTYTRPQLVVLPKAAGVGLCPPLNLFRQANLCGEETPSSFCFESCYRPSRILEL